MSNRCLLLYPRFSEFSFWNYSEACRLVGYKYPTSPLGLMTVAALLPPDWQCRLVDLNTRDLDLSCLRWADLVMVGGMITQQPEILKLIRLAHEYGKPVVVGGPDASSQPEIYREADFLVLDEGERTIPPFLESWNAGKCSGTFRSRDIKPDIQKTPIPRFDLVRLEDYEYIGVQSSRGCPYQCEFCDIIELYGRLPRVKSSDQMIAELEGLYRRGYRGHVDFVDDNFIGNKKAAKQLLEALIHWSEQRAWPFFFSTEATITLAQDPELLSLMHRCDFRYVFIGIETPDPELLRRTQKKQNTLRPIADSIRRIHESGIAVLSGFILGFDHEAPGAAKAIVQCIEESGICVATFGLLTSLPNTQLERRLAREGRLITQSGTLLVGQSEHDQMSGGLNFVTTRPRLEILSEYREALSRLYSSRGYFARLGCFLNVLQPKVRHRPPLALLPRFALGLLRTTFCYLRSPRIFLSYAWLLLKSLLLGQGRFYFSVCFSMLFLHFRRQTAFIVEHLDSQERRVKEVGEDAYIRELRQSKNVDNVSSVV